MVRLFFCDLKFGLQIAKKSESLSPIVSVHFRRTASMECEKKASWSDEVRHWKRSEFIPKLMWSPHCGSLRKARQPNARLV